MEIFIGIKKLLRILGFLKFEHSNSRIEKAIYIFQKFFLFCCSPFLFLPPLWFLFFRAETFFEKTYTSLISVLVFLATIMYYILSWKREQMLELFAQLESKVLERNTSEDILKYQSNKIVMFILPQVNNME